MKRGQVYRTAIVVGLASLLTVTACTGGGGSGGPGPNGFSSLTVGDYGGAVNDIPDLVAQAEGFFQQEKVDVKFITISNGPSQTSAVASGSLDVESNTPDNVMLSIDKNLDIKPLVNYIRGIFYTVLVQKDWPTPNIKAPYPGGVVDLKGARIGVTARGASVELVTSQLLEQAGLDPSSVTFIAVGGPGPALAAWQAKQIDALISYEPQTARLYPSDAKLLVDPQKDDPRLSQWNAQLRATTGDKLKNNPEAYAGYVRAFRHALDFIKDPANEARVISTIGPKLGLTPEVAKTVLARVRPTIDPTLTCPGWQTVGEYLLRAKLISAPKDVQACEGLKGIPGN